MRRACARGVRMLALAMDVDEERAMPEYADVAPPVCKEAGLTATPDSRLLGCKVFDCDWQSSG